MQGSGDRPHRLKFIRGARSRPRHHAPCGPAKQGFLPCRGQMVVHVGFSIIAVSQRVSGCSSTHGEREREREVEGRAPSSIRPGERHRAGRAAPPGYVHPHIRWVIEVYLQQDQRGAQLSLVIGCGPPKPGGKAARACISSACTPWTSRGGGAGDSRCPRWHEACSRQEVRCRYGGIAARAWLGMDADETFGSPVTGRDRKRIQ